MLEFEILQELELNAEILEIIKEYEYTVESGKVKHLKTTNLQFIEPNEYWLKVNSWGETSEKCFTPAFFMGLNKTHKK